MSTARDIITRSLRLLGVYAQGETPAANEASEALTALTNMLDAWNIEQGMLYSMSNSLFALTNGTSSYTIGPAGSGATWESEGVYRPDQIPHEGIFVRQGTADFPIEYYENDRFQSLADKSTAGMPCIWTYDYDYPIGTIRVYPAPNESSLYFGFTEHKQLTNMTSLDESLVMPQGYENAIVYNLAMELAPEYGQDPPLVVVSRAQEYKRKIKNSNSRMTTIDCDPALTGVGHYDINSDGYVE